MSSYPGGFDSLPDPVPTDELDSLTVPHAGLHSQVHSAIEAVQQTLGTNPQGSFATVKARLDALGTGGGGSGSDWVNVKDHGVVGDGVTNDTAALQALLTSSPAGASLWFPEGTYLISSGLTFQRDGLTLAGTGRSSRILLAPVTVKTDMLILDDVRNVTIAGLAFDANIAANPHATAHTTCIHLTQCPNIRILDVAVTGGNIEGVYIGQSGGIEIDGLDSSGNGVFREDASGLHLDGCWHANVTGAICKSNGFHGIILTGCQKVNISNAICEDNGYNGLMLQVGCTYVNVNNLQASSNFRGVMIQEWTDLCNFTNTVTNSNDTSGFVLNNATDIVLDGFVARDNSEYGIDQKDGWSQLKVGHARFRDNGLGETTVGASGSEYTDTDGGGSGGGGGPALSDDFPNATGLFNNPGTADTASRSDHVHSSPPPWDQWINVLDRGVTGDGVTDDTAALNDVFAAASAEKKNVFMPRGTYLVSDTLRLPGRAGTMVVGAGVQAGTTIKLAATATGDITIISPVTYQSVGVTIQDIFVDGNDASGARVGTCRITGIGPAFEEYDSQLSLRRVAVRNCNTIGVYLSIYRGAISADVEINACQIGAIAEGNVLDNWYVHDNRGNGLQVKGDSWVRSSTFHRNGGNGIWWNQPTGFMSDCKCTSNTLSGLNIDGYYSTFGIANCMFNSNTLDGITMAGTGNYTLEHPLLVGGTVAQNKRYGINLTLATDRLRVTGALVSRNTTAPKNEITAGSLRLMDDLWSRWSGTQAQYDAIATKDPNTLYVVI